MKQNKKLINNNLILKKKKIKIKIINNNNKINKIMKINKPRMKIFPKHISISNPSPPTLHIYHPLNHT
jgi:hypothetical protein